MHAPRVARAVLCRNVALRAQKKPFSTNRLLATNVQWPVTHEQINKVVNTQNFIDNIFAESKASQWNDLHDPATNHLVTKVPESTDAELNEAVQSAREAFKSWRKTTWLHRQQIMFKFVALIRENWDRLAASIT
ncbi:hypothetical protein KC336_g21696, partial [Hortaea werneckii]